MKCAMMCRGAFLVLLALVGSPIAHAKVFRGSNALDTGMQPDVVARTLQQVEQKWQAEAYSFVKCNPAQADCSGTPNAFSKSCSTVISAIVQGSSGDKHAANEYMDVVCSQKIQGMHKQHCMNLKAALAKAMTADSYQNRNGFDSDKLCTGFWSEFVKEEKVRFAKEEEQRIAAEKKAAEDAAREAKEAAEKKATEEAAQKKAAEEAEKKAAEEAAQKKIEEAKRVKAEAQAKAKEAAEKLATKKAEAAEFAKKAAEKMEEAAEAEREHKKATDLVKQGEAAREQKEAKEAKDKSDKKEATPTKAVVAAPVEAAPAKTEATPTKAAAPVVEAKEAPSTKEAAPVVEAKAKTIALPVEPKAAPVKAPAVAKAMPAAKPVKVEAAKK